MTDTDWQDAIFRTAYSTKHSVSVSGRTKTLGYYIGANYLYREERSSGRISNVTACGPTSTASATG